MAIRLRRVLRLFACAPLLLASCADLDELVEAGQSAAADAGHSNVGMQEQAATTPVCTSSARGDYCAGNGVTGGTTGTLYSCTGLNKVATVKQVCSVCFFNSPGYNDVCARRLAATSTNRTNLTSGNYNSSGMLLYADAGSGSSLLRGGNRLAGSRNQTGGLTSVEVRDTAYMNQCTDFVQSVTATSTTGTSAWRRGRNVLANCSSLPVGTAVATFTSAGAYSGHTGILRGCTSSRIDLWDQNYVQVQRVAKNSLTNVVSSSLTATNDASNYYEVLIPE